MIICMNIGTDGNRYIAKIIYVSTWSRKSIQENAIQQNKTYDEVYVIDFKENEAFIYEVVLRGCRV